MYTQLFNRFPVHFADDLDVSPDFFEYFAATYPILRNDPSLWCVSAWNDNGKGNMVADDPGRGSSGHLTLYGTCFVDLSLCLGLLLFLCNTFLINSTNSP